MAKRTLDDRDLVDAGKPALGNGGSGGSNGGKKPSCLKPPPSAAAALESVAADVTGAVEVVPSESVPAKSVLPEENSEQTFPVRSIDAGSLEDLREEYFCRIRAVCPRIDAWNAWAMAFETDIYGGGDGEDAAGPTKTRNILNKATVLEKKCKGRIAELRAHPDLETVKVHATKDERMLLWTSIMRSRKTTREEQMKASRLLAQTEGDFDKLAGGLGSGEVTVVLNLAGPIRDRTVGGRRRREELKGIEVEDLQGGIPMENAVQAGHKDKRGRLDYQGVDGKGGSG